MRFALALSAAFLIGLGFVAQQHAAYREPLGEILHVRLLTHLVRSRLWLGGIAAMVGGQILGALALNVGDVARIEPLLATSLIFALFAAHLIYQERLAGTEWSGALLAAGGVVLFLAFGRPHGGRPAGPESLRWLAAAIVVAAVIVLVTASLHTPLRPRAMLLATAAGMLYGFQDALTRSSLVTLGGGLHAMIWTWQPYALLCAAFLGLLLTQSAFDAAPLRVSLPATTVAEPLTGIGLGIAVFAERLQLSPGALAGEVAGLLAMVTGTVVLGRSPFLAKRERAAKVMAEAERR